MRSIEAEVPVDSAQLDLLAGRVDVLASVLAAELDGLLDPLTQLDELLGRISPNATWTRSGSGLQSGVEQADSGDSVDQGPRSWPRRTELM